MIEAVMLWNEPNNLSHWDRELDPQWNLFAQMVQQAGDRLGAIAPGLTRVLGGISPIDPFFIEHLFHLGVGPSIDVVAVHGFPLDWNRWHLDEWPDRVQRIRAVAQGKPVWATEVGVSSFVSEELQAWAVDPLLAALAPEVDRVYWYALMDLPEEWEATTRHRSAEGSAYFRHFRMGLYGADGQPKQAAPRLARWAGEHAVGVCEWVYWQEGQRLTWMVRRLQELGVRRLRTGLSWADWERPGASDWFDFVMGQLRAFDVTLTLCFTPAHAAVRPHHTSPPCAVEDYAAFCETVVRRYAPEHLAAPPATTGAGK